MKLMLSIVGLLALTVTQARGVSSDPPGEEAKMLVAAKIYPVDGHPGLTVLNSVIHDAVNVKQDTSKPESAWSAFYACRESRQDDAACQSYASELKKTATNGIPKSMHTLLQEMAAAEAEFKSIPLESQLEWYKKWIARTDKVIREPYAVGILGTGGMKNPSRVDRIARILAMMLVYGQEHRISIALVDTDERWSAMSLDERRASAAVISPSVFQCEMLTPAESKEICPVSDESSVTSSAKLAPVTMSSGRDWGIEYPPDPNITWSFVLKNAKAKYEEAKQICANMDIPPEERRKMSAPLMMDVAIALQVVPQGMGKSAGISYLAGCKDEVRPVINPLIMRVSSLKADPKTTWHDIVSRPKKAYLSDGNLVNALGNLYPEYMSLIGEDERGTLIVMTHPPTMYQNVCHGEVCGDMGTVSAAINGTREWVWKYGDPADWSNLSHDDLWLPSLTDPLRQLDADPILHDDHVAYLSRAMAEKKKLPDDGVQKINAQAEKALEACISTAKRELESLRSSGAQARQAARDPRFDVWTAKIKSSSVEVSMPLSEGVDFLTRFTSDLANATLGMHEWSCRQRYSVDAAVLAQREKFAKTILSELYRAAKKAGKPVQVVNFTDVWVTTIAYRDSLNWEGNFNGSLAKYLARVDQIRDHYVLTRQDAVWLEILYLEGYTTGRYDSEHASAHLGRIAELARPLGAQGMTEAKTMIERTVPNRIELVFTQPALKELRGESKKK